MSAEVITFSIMLFLFPFIAKFSFILSNLWVDTLEEVAKNTLYLIKRIFK